MKIGSIGNKITLIIFLSVSIITAAGITLMYLVGLNLLNDATGKQYAQISRLLGTHVKDAIKGEIEDANVYTTLPLWVDLIKDANLKYKQMNPQQVDDYLKETDKKWISARKGEPFLWEYLENRISVAMRDIVKLRGNMAGIFVTDRYGGIVASSKKMGNFRQADEEWWQKAYNKGKGDTYVSDIEFDDSSAAWVINVAVPMKDKDNAVIGICRVSLSIQRLFESLNDFKIGNTGYAFLTDNKGMIIYHHNMPSMDKKLFSEKEMDNLLSAPKKFAVILKKLLYDKKVFMAFSEISPPYLSQRGAKWVIFIVQDAAELSSPLDTFVIQLGIIACCLIVLMLALGSFFGSMIARPIHKLHMATEHIMEGDWNYKIEVKTGDEIEQFADTFSEMIANIKAKQTELEDLSRSLESKVAERTKELSETQEATLNILDDLEEAKTSLERSNKELKYLDQLKSDFVSTVSHELRTPLSIIKEGVSLVLDKVPGDISEKQQKILEISKFNIDRLARIIDNLLDISKIEAGKVELRRNLIDISDTVKQIASSFEIKVKEKGLNLKLDVDNMSGKVYADSDRIAQVLINLISNAIKFTPSGYIEISCKDNKDFVACSVKDTGVGISKDDLPKLFDKFQQFGRLIGAGERGTGLGLSIAKSIIDMHNGTISVESEPKKGSCFTFALHKYTKQALLMDFTDKAIKRAAQSKSKVSIVIISSKSKEGLNTDAWLKNLHAAMNDCARLIKNTLRSRDDDLVSDNGDMLAILAGCNKEHSVFVRQRLEQILNKYLTEQKIRDRIDITYGYATFPDDGKTSMELIKKTHSNIFP